MKKYLVIFIGALVLYSCDKSTDATPQGNSKMMKSESEVVGSFTSIEDMFEFLVDYSADLEITEEEILEGQLSFNAESGEVTLLSLEQKEPDFFIIPGMGGGDDGTQYQVTCCCDANGNEIFNSTCDGKFSCGKLIFDCLQANACAEICAATIYFHPNTKFLALDQTLTSGN